MKWVSCFGLQISEISLLLLVEDSDLSCFFSLDECHVILDLTSVELKLVKVMLSNKGVALSFFKVHDSPGTW